MKREIEPHATLLSVVVVCAAFVVVGGDYIALIWFYNMATHKNEKWLTHMPHQLPSVSEMACLMGEREADNNCHQQYSRN